MPVKKRSKGGRSSRYIIPIDMSGVETSLLVPEGDYTVVVDEVTLETSDNSGKEYLKWKFRISEGDYKGQPLYYNTSLQPQALFNLKNVLISLGVTVPSGVMNLDLRSLPGLSCGVSVEHETYEGKKRARIVDFFPLDSMEGEEEEEELDEELEELEEDEEDEDEEEEYDEEELEAELEAMSLEELKKFAERHDVDLSGLSKADRKNPQKVRTYIRKELQY